MPKNILSHYDKQNDRWIFDLPHGVAQSVLKGLADYVYKINKDRWLCASGETKERIGFALRALEQGRYIGRLTGKGDQELFKATQGTGKIISIGESK